MDKALSCGVGYEGLKVRYCKPILTRRDDPGRTSSEYVGPVSAAGAYPRLRRLLSHPLHLICPEWCVSARRT